MKLGGGAAATALDRREIQPQPSQGDLAKGNDEVVLCRTVGGRGALGREEAPKSRGVARHGADVRAALAAVFGGAADGILVRDSPD